MNVVSRISRNRKLHKKYSWFYKSEDADYSFSDLDLIPPGWSKAFGEMLLEDIDKVLKENDIEDFQIIDIKEKWGRLDVFTSPYTKEIDDVLSVYEDISTCTCIYCGKPDTDMTYSGWLEPICGPCWERYQREPYEDINHERQYPKYDTDIEMFDNRMNKIRAWWKEENS